MFILDLFFVLSFVLVPIVAVYLLRYSKVSLYEFSIPSLFIIFYFCFDYIGIFRLFFQLDFYSHSIGIVEREIILRLFFYTSSSFLLIVFGFVFAHNMLGAKRTLTVGNQVVSANKRQWYLVGGLFLMCIAVLFIYLKQVGNIALFKVLEGDLYGAAIARSNMGNAFEGKYWRYHLFFRHLMDFCVIFFFSDYLIRKRTSSLVMFVVSFMAAAFSALMSIEKGPFAFLLIMLYVTYALHNGGRYWQPVSKYFLLGIMMLLSLFYVSFMDASTILEAVQHVLSRVSRQITPAYFYLELFPDEMNYLWGTSFPNPGGLLPFENFPLTKYMSLYMSDFNASDAIVGSAPTVFWAEMYANFGPLGVFISSFLVGVVIYLLSNFLTRKHNSPVNIAAYVVLAIHFCLLTTTSLSTYFIDIMFFTIILVIFFLKIRFFESKQVHSVSISAG